MSDLFDFEASRQRQRIAPLADRMRPRRLDDFVGQAAILGPGRLLRRAITADRVGNLILHGPPGVGKTTLARIIAATTRSHFASLNAVLAGVKELRAEVEAARERLGRHGLRSFLFIDEVHRFNAAQQDALLPWVENGTITLIGATTENPFFEVNKALVSRSRLFRLQPLEPADLRQLLVRALADPEHGYGGRPIKIEERASAHLLDVAGGDARCLLNALELAVETTEPDANGAITIDLAIAEESIQQRAVLYDKQGDAHFDTISAFIKSLRGSDPDAALFWLARMVEAGENPRFIFRRMLIAAGEDVGLADPQAVVVVEACAAAFERVGLPEGLYPLAQAALYLASTEKSNSVLGFFDALKSVRSAASQSVPSPLRDGNRDGQAFGDGKGYRYPHAYADHWVAQTYLPGALQGQVFWQPGGLGWEGSLKGRVQQRRAAQLAAAAETMLAPGSWQGELLSSSPADPQLELWLQRQGAAEGERLDQLRQRFWQGAGWQRHDRVLILEARSLLWAIDPLEATPEGGMVIGVAQPEDLERLQAHLQLLDALRQPRLRLISPDQPELLLTQLDPGERFEWLAARQPFQGLGPTVVQRWMETLTALSSDSAELRLLFSAPSIGPAESLLAWLGSQNRAAAEPSQNQQRLEACLPLEQPWLQQAATSTLAAVRGELERLGWRVSEEGWQECLPLALSPGLVERWFAAEASYRKIINQGFSDDEITALRTCFEASLDAKLPQRIVHCLLIARRKGSLR
ncbi:AAA family ATPase [Synechococcus sp. CS-1325]|uniref:AAA family ATPase n=1 Tax=unclassified Synechococcus TaxID=2626047 RepID=UPI000DB11CA0|nr:MULTISPECIES: AAA family ATPase [unclassified Synechococcus]MCT0199762.1 AAA family ATPase [Synechococcus sp. CS-1325]MCT0214218.1 AAA family ATPase [Synechococcus sp. CS-1326]PZV01083.1 MAG: recombination protein RarA [Cyanobium sp.]